MTDKEVFGHNEEGIQVVPAQFARNLERQLQEAYMETVASSINLTDARARVEEMEGALKMYANTIGIWWTMVEADRECSDQDPLKAESVVLHFMGSGASTQVSVSDLRELNAKVQSALLSAKPSTDGKGVES